MSKSVTERAIGRQPAVARAGRDAGHTGVEMVAVLAIVGFLASVVALMVTGMRTEAASASCTAEAGLLTQAAAQYLVIHGGDTIPGAGDGTDRYEVTLVESGMLRSTSTQLDLDAHGAVVTPENSPC